MPDEIREALERRGFSVREGVMEKIYDCPAGGSRSKREKEAAEALDDGDFVVTSVFHNPPDYEMSLVELT